MFHALRTLCPFYYFVVGNVGLLFIFENRTPHVRQRQDRKYEIRNGSKWNLRFDLNGYLYLEPTFFNYLSEKGCTIKQNYAGAELSN